MLKVSGFIDPLTLLFGGVPHLLYIDTTKSYSVLISLD